MKPTLLVLAAGMGSRYGGLKQIDPVGPSGEIIIDYSIYDAIRAGFGKVVFVIRRDIEEDFRKFVGTRYESAIPVEYVFQELDRLPEGFTVPQERSKPWGTGHAVLMAEPMIHESFAVINADDYYGRDSFRLLAETLTAASAQESEPDGPEHYCMCGFVLRNTLSENGSVSRGICTIDEDHFLVDVEEITQIEKSEEGARYLRGGREIISAGDEIVSMNMWGFGPGIFRHLNWQFEEFLRERINEEKSEFFIPTVVNNMVKSGAARVRVRETGESWFGITYREDKPKVVESLRKLTDAGVYPQQLF